MDIKQEEWKMETNSDIKVAVRWHDGYMEKFDCVEVRFGCDLLWMRLVSGQNRHIPLRSVRWFSETPESHETPLPNDGKEDGENDG